jgi:hypothetical protein
MEGGNRAFGCVLANAGGQSTLFNMAAELEVSEFIIFMQNPVKPGIHQFPYGLPECDLGAMYKKRMYVFQAKVDQTIERIISTRLSRNNTLTMYTTDPNVKLYVEFAFSCLPVLAVKLGRITPTVINGTLSFSFCLGGPSPPDTSATVQLWVGTRKARVLLTMSTLVVRAKLETISTRQRLDTMHKPRKTSMRAPGGRVDEQLSHTTHEPRASDERVDEQLAPEQPQKRMCAFDPDTRIDDLLAYSWLELFVQ